ncbi:deoxyribonuclease IV [Brevibacillus fluminis]|uniref:Probable endonuclease 4 n=1 Tax=Brevibacillus fluminis TaxID=511487 RepID=A0A3M8DSL3_9BACL|nr:deoxyribonuclease IV [Brevibacillus fluminis]RNB90435.1 deoxyribonuclease IV [Brevibacillus fluminis]
MLRIGSHVSFSGKGLLNAAEEAVAYGSSTFMIYTGAPQNTRRKPIEDQYIEKGKAIMDEQGIGEIVVHAPYIINLGTFKEDNFEFAVQFLQEEIRRTAYIGGAKNIVLHPGAYTEMDAEYGIKRIAEGLNEVLNGVKDNDVKIALETMAGKGTEVGRSFEEIAAIIDKVEANNRLSVCMDTCHIHDAGYDVVNDFDGVLEQFDRIVGLDRIAVVHLNDSKSLIGTGKDRHAPVGAGMIGFDAMNRIVHHEKIRHLPLILETPWIGKSKEKLYPMYEAEIALLRGDADGRFGTAFITDVEKLADFFRKQEVDRRDFVINTWHLLKTDAKAKKADGREPMERLYDMVTEANLFEGLAEEEINFRLIGWFANVHAAKTV